MSDQKPGFRESMEDVVDALRDKIDELIEKNHELIERAKLETAKIKDQASSLKDRIAHTQLFIMTMAFFKRCQGLLKAWRILPVKKLVCLKINDQYCYMYGYVEAKTYGMVIIRDAWLLKYDDPSLIKNGYDQPFEADFIGNPIICREQIIVILDTTEKGRKALELNLY